MRFVSLALAPPVALTLTACNSKTASNSSTHESNAAATAAAPGPSAAQAPAPDASASAKARANGQVPKYPGAVTQYSGTSSSMGQTARGTVATTDDSFDKVYAWYQSHLPAGSEKAHVTAPV